MNSKPLGLLLILPNVAQKDLTSKVEKVWNQLQEVLATHKLNIPIYFTFEDFEKSKMYDDLKNEHKKKLDGTADGNIFTRKLLTLEVKAADPVLTPSLELPVLYGTFKSDEEIRNTNKPLILITASSDFLTIAPGMSRGINSASGMMAVYDISRYFSQLLEDPKLKESAEFDFMFALTPGSWMNYELSGQFIESLNDKIKERISFIISLDSLAYADDMTFYFGNMNSKESKFAKEVLQLMRESSSKFNKNIKFNKKPSPGNFYEWEHLRFSEKGISFAGTLTSYKNVTFENQYEKFSVFDTEDNFDAAAYEINIKIITDFLAKLILPSIKRDERFIKDDATLVDFKNQTQFINFLTSNQRIPTKMVTNSKIVLELQQMMKLSIKNTKVRKIRVNNPKFYDDTPVVQRMKYYRAGSQIYNILYYGAIVGSLVAVYYLLKRLFSRRKVKKS